MCNLSLKIWFWLERHLLNWKGAFLQVLWIRLLLCQVPRVMTLFLRPLQVFQISANTCFSNVQKCHCFVWFFVEQRCFCVVESVHLVNVGVSHSISFPSSFCLRLLCRGTLIGHMGCPRSSPCVTSTDSNLPFQAKSIGHSFGSLA